MVVEQSDIFKLIKAGQPDFIKEAKEEQTKLNMHVNGIGVDQYLDKVEGHENVQQHKLRKKFAMSNKFVFANLLRPVDKVFSAKGGNRIYQTKGKTAEKKLRDILTKIRFGKSIRKFIQMVQANKFYSDPSGLVFFEWGEKDGEANTYPTIKSIQVIRNYLTDGRRVEWILFEPVKRIDEKGETIEGDFYRFVDDEKDITYKYIDDNNISVADVEGSPGTPDRHTNPWNEVPAIVNSDIPNSELTFSDSPIDPLVELADKYLRTNTIKSIHEFLHGFPFFWMYQKKCESCKGTGEVNGETCTDCRGTGMSLKRDVSDVTLLRPPKNKESPTIAPDVAGYVVPPIEIPEEQREELGWVWTMMHFTMWGTSFTPADNETATGRFLDVQPVNDRLGQLSDSFEDMEQRMTDLIGKFYLGEIYQGSSISYGRRYMMEPADELWKKYLDAKQKQAPRATLNQLLLQYYQSEYANDMEMQAMMTKALKVEPFAHSTSVEVRPLIDQETFKQKLYFGEWWLTLEEQYIIVTAIEKLKKDLAEYVKEKEVPEFQPPVVGGNN